MEGARNAAWPVHPPIAGKGPIKSGRDAHKFYKKFSPLEEGQKNRPRSGRPLGRLRQLAQSSIVGFLFPRAKFLPMAEHAEEAVAKHFISTFGHSPRRVKQVCGFIVSLGEFVHDFVTNHYYSDALGKKAVVLGFDADALYLRADALKLEHLGFLRDAENAIMSKKKPHTDAAAFRKFLSKLGALEAEAVALNEKATALTLEVKKDYVEKQR
jgi:hypothetical protein